MSEQQKSQEKLAQSEQNKPQGQEQTVPIENVPKKKQNNLQGVIKLTSGAQGEEQDEKKQRPKKQLSETDEHDLKQYDPYAHRHTVAPSSDIRSLTNLVKSSLGSGILAMPLAIANAGWLVGTFSTFMVAFLCTHCIQLFIRTSRGVCIKKHVPLLNYSETCRGAFETGPKQFKIFAKPAFIFANICLIATYLGVCCTYTVLIANSIKQPIDRYVLSANVNVQYYLVIILIPLCLLVQVKHLKYLAISSSIANIFFLLTFMICLFFIFEDTVTIYDKDAVGDWSRYPIFLSTAVFAMEGMGVVMPIENSMQNPQHFLGIPGILCIAMCIITFLYVTLGLFGYLRYGDMVRGSITLNLPIDHWLAIFAKIFIAISLFFTYPLQFFVVTNTLITLLRPFLIKHIAVKHEDKAEIIIKVVLVVLCGAFGIAIPLLEQIIDIVGALFFSVLGFVIPGVIDTVFNWKDLGQYKWILWKNAVVVFFGLFCMVSGCIVTIKDISDILSEPYVEDDIDF